MKRSRSGCQTCRSRRVKCDEARPICRNCIKRGVQCVYGIKYQWIPHEVQSIFRKTSRDVSSDSISDADDVGTTRMRTTSIKSSKRGSSSANKSNKCLLEQTAVGLNRLRMAIKRPPKTVMEEVEFEPADEPILSLNGPGSLSQFKKFSIKPKDEVKNTKSIIPTGPDPFLRHSPLFRPVIYGPYAGQVTGNEPGKTADQSKSINEQPKRNDNTFGLGERSFSAALNSAPTAPVSSVASPTPSSMGFMLPTGMFNDAYNVASHLSSNSDQLYQQQQQQQQQLFNNNGTISAMIYGSSGQKTPFEVASQGANISRNQARHRHQHTHSQPNHQPHPQPHHQHMQNLSTGSVPPSAIFGNSISADDFPTHASSSSFSGLSHRDFFEHFVEVTANAIVPIPYDENPFRTLLPKLAYSNQDVYNLLVAYGASHKSMLEHGDLSDPVDNEIVEKLIGKCAARLEVLRLDESGGELALLSATVLALIEVDRGNVDAWHKFMHLALNIIKSRVTFSQWNLEQEVNSMTFRLVGYMTGIGSLFSTREVLEFPSWPQWNGNLDFLTGIDLNLLPMFSETAELIAEVNRNWNRWTLGERVVINNRALQIMQRMNDYWLEEHRPENEITAMCIMFQEALQIHVLRRVLRFSTDHPMVRRIVNLAMSHLERFVPPASTIQRCMTFSLATIASETLVPEHRTSLMIRLRHMGDAGFAYNIKVSDDIRRHWANNTSLIETPTSVII